MGEEREMEMILMGMGRIGKAKGIPEHLYYTVVFNDCTDLCRRVTLALGVKRPSLVNVQLAQTEFAVASGDIRRFANNRICQNASRHPLHTS